MLGMLGAACASQPQPRVPAPPMLAGGAAAAQPTRAPRPTPGPEVQRAIPQGDVVAAGEAFVTALYAADDATAATYQPGFGELLRKDEDRYELLDMRARPMAWAEAGYPDADPSLEWAEVITRVNERTGTQSGTVYYKLGFKRGENGLKIDLWSRRLDLR